MSTAATLLWGSQTPARPVPVAPVEAGQVGQLSTCHVTTTDSWIKSGPMLQLVLLMGGRF